MLGERKTPNTTTVNNPEDSIMKEVGLVWGLNLI
jgi:hypothetical protein